MKRIISIVITLVLLSTMVIAIGASYSAEYINGTYTETPAWYEPEWAGNDNFERYHNDNFSRVVDWADIFTDDEEAELEGLIKDLTQEHGYDLLIYTDDTDYGAGWEQNARDIYDYWGYGCGDNFSGSVFFICMEEGNRGRTQQGTGDVEPYFDNYSITEKIDDDTQPYLADGEYFEACKVYISDLDTLYTNQGFPTVYSVSDFVGPVIVALIVGVIVGFIVRSVAMANMKTVQTATNATSYIVPGTFNITTSKDHYLYTTTTRVYSPKEKSSGGSSSHSSGSSGGGGSFSGSSRGF